MFAEIVAITSALSAINSTISTFKEAQANASDVSRLVGKFGGTSEKLDDWERKKKLKRPLTTKEAIDLSLARRQVKTTERALKDICLMAGCGDVWREAERLRSQSEREQKEFLRTIHAKRKARKIKMQGIGTAVFIAFSIVCITWGGYVVYQGTIQAQERSETQKKKARRQVYRNIRKCGRSDCG